MASNCGWCRWCAIFSGRMCTSQNRTMTTTGTKKMMKMARYLATESSSSGDSNDAFAAEGRANDHAAATRPATIILGMGCERVVVSRTRGVGVIQFTCEVHASTACARGHERECWECIQPAMDGQLPVSQPIVRRTSGCRPVVARPPFRGSGGSQPRLGPLRQFFARPPASYPSAHRVANHASPASPFGSCLGRSRQAVIQD